MASTVEISLTAFICSSAALVAFLLYTYRSGSSSLALPFTDMEDQKLSAKNQSAFKATRLTASTFLIKEFNDAYSEHPHIYAKLVPSANTLLLIDTGCGGESKDPNVKVKSLRVFIETVGVEDNEGKPLNEGGKLEYVVVTSHCHYDHILAVEQFKDSPILASSRSPAYLSPENLPIHTLCSALGIRTPSYTPTLVPHLHQIYSSDGKKPLGMSVLHTPGHTPDELALYDAQEKMLYVGDTLYEHDHIIFPKEGSIVEWFSSLELLVSFVRARDSEAEDTGLQNKMSSNVRINSGHRTVGRPALDVLLATKAFMEDVVEGKEPIKKRMMRRGEETVAYKQDGGQFALICPERLVLEARAAGADK